MLGFLKTLAWVPMSIVYPVKIKNRKKMPKGKAIIVMNHTSNMDIVLFVLHTLEKKYVLAKKELFTTKSRSRFLKSIGAIKVDRDNFEPSSMKEILRLLKNGKKIIIFPEGTRNKGDINQMLPIRDGTAILATKTKTPIIPIRVNRRAKAFRRTTFTIGDPFELDEFYGKKLSREDLDKANNIIVDKINELK